MKLIHSYLFATNCLSRIIGQQLDIRLLDHGVTHQQVFTMMALDENYGIHISGLAEILLTNRTTIHKNLNRLDKKGYISYVRKRDKSNRLHSLIYLTEKAKQLLYALVILMQEWESDFLRVAVESKSSEIPNCNGIYVQNFLLNLHYLGLYQERGKKS